MAVWTGNGQIAEPADSHLHRAKDRNPRPAEIKDVAAEDKRSAHDAVCAISSKYEWAFERLAKQVQVWRQSNIWTLLYYMRTIGNENHCLHFTPYRWRVRSAATSLIAMVALSWRPGYSGVSLTFGRQ